MQCISIHTFFSGCWAETEIMILSPHTLLSWHNSSVWSIDRRHRSVSDPHFWDPERDRIRLVEAADSHSIPAVLPNSLTHWSDASILQRLLSHLQHIFLSVSFHSASEHFLIHFLFWFTYCRYLIKKKKKKRFVCKAFGIVCYFLITNMPPDFLNL